MQLWFPSTRLKKDFTDVKRRRRRFGVRRSELINVRLQDMAAALTLEDLRHAPGRYHELRGDRSRQISVDLDHPYRLIFEPVHEPLPVDQHGRLLWEGVTAVMILEVADTHE